jgi:hypothetical protein
MCSILVGKPLENGCMGSEEMEVNMNLGDGWQMELVQDRVQWCNYGISDVKPSGSLQKCLFSH